jgi:hypothetical protein
MSSDRHNAFSNFDTYACRLNSSSLGMFDWMLPREAGTVLRRISHALEAYSTLCRAMRIAENAFTTSRHHGLTAEGGGSRISRTAQTSLSAD